MLPLQGEKFHITHIVIHEMYHVILRVWSQSLFSPLLTTSVREIANAEIVLTELVEFIVVRYAWNMLHCLGKKK